MLRKGVKNTVDNPNSTGENLKVWCSNLTEADFKLREYRCTGWSIIEPLTVKWNWKRFTYCYCFRISKNRKNKNRLLVLNNMISTLIMSYF